MVLVGKGPNMRPNFRRLTAAAFATALAFGGVACDDEEAAEVGDEVEEGVNDAEEGAEDVGNEIQEGAENVEEEVDGEGE
ncbi:hypothetical protein BH24ACT1_BH24ACT1_08890 [soil metagenome]